MESLGTAVLELVANVKPLEAGLAKGKAASEEMAKTTATGFRGGIQKAAIPAALAVGVLAVGLHHAVAAAEADQVAQDRLAKTFEDSHVPITKYQGLIDSTVSKSAALGFKSVEVKKSLGSLMVATHDAAKSAALLGTAQDIARFKGVGLEQATKMLVLAQTGSQRATKQLGLTVQATTTAQDAAKQSFKDAKAALDAQYGSTSKMTVAEKAQYDSKLNTLMLNEKSNLAIAKYTDTQATAAKVTALVNEKLHGQADAFAKTGQGAKEKLGAELNLLSIDIGKMLLPALDMITSALATAAGWMTKHATIAKILIAVVGTLATAILLLAAYTKVAAAAQWVMNTAMDANPIGLIITGIAALVIAFVVLWKHSQTFRDIVLGVWKSVKDTTLAFVHFFTRDIPGAFTTVLSWVKQHWPLIAVIISGPFAPLVALATNAFGVRSALTGALQTVLGWVRTAWSAVGGFLAAPFTTAWTVIHKILQLIVGGWNLVISGIDAIHWGGVSILGQTVVPGFGGFKIPKIPMLGAGGIVHGPTLAMIGEKGPEAVVPLNGSHGLGSSIVVNVSGVVGNPHDVAMAIGRELENISRRGTHFNFAVS